MYTVNSFDQYPELKNIIKKHGIKNFLDPLTKTIMRGHIMNFIESLIKEKRQFSLIIMDIDNFKYINDNYGHHIGDLVLTETAKNIIDAVGDTGIVGRFGGDEFIIVDFVHNDYDSMHSYLVDFYEIPCVSPFRRYVKVEDVNLFITGTIGTANFPNNSTDFDDLFSKADKALYRGKMKGRNCFIIYVHEKHKDIDISKLMKEPIQNSIYNLFQMFDERNDISYLKNESFNYIKKILKISDILFINRDRVLDFNDSIVVSDIEDFLDDMNVGVYNSVTEICEKSEDMERFISNTGLVSVLISKVMFKGECYGYVVFGDKSVLRIWQNDDVALAVAESRLLGALLRYAH